jgi:Fe2+ transport system protein FeoA
MKECPPLLLERKFEHLRTVLALVQEMSRFGLTPPANCEVVHRDKGDDIYSISVDLSEVD